MGGRGNVGSRNVEPLQTQTVERKEYSHPENRAYVVKRLVKNGFGVPEAIRAYNQMSNNGWYEVEKDELTKWIRENGF